MLTLWHVVTTLYYNDCSICKLVSRDHVYRSMKLKLLVYGCQWKLDFLDYVQKQISVKM